MKIKSFVFIVFAFLALSLPPEGIGKTESLEDKKIYQKAEDEFKKHNYKNSLELYKKYFKTLTEENKKTSIALKILETEKNVNLWDQLLEDYDIYKNISKNTLFQAQLSSFMADVYEDIPHSGYKRDNKVYRQQDIREGDYVYLEQQDRVKTDSFYRDSKDFYSKQKESASIYEEVINLNFRFASFLQRSRYYYYSGTVKKISVQQKVNKSVRPNYNQYNDETTKQVILLYDEIIELNEIVKKEDYTVRSMFKKASYFSNKNGWSYNYETTQDEKIKNEDPLPLLLKIVEKYPNSSYAPEAFFSIAQIEENKGNKEKALSIYEKLVRKYPKSLLVNDCKYHIKEIKRKELYINTIGIVQSETKPKLSINVRNIKNISVNIYKIDMVDILKKNVNDYNIQFSNMNQNFGYNLNDFKKYYGKNLASFTITPNYKDNYQQITSETEINVSKSGAYVVEVEGDDAIKSATLFLVSDIVMVRNSDKNKILIHILDRETGKPIKNSNLLIKEHFYKYSDPTQKYYYTHHKSAKTDENGFYSYSKKYNQTTNASYFTDILAWKNNDITISDAQYWYNYDYNNVKSYKGYINTDRPVYRPNQRVNFKQVLRLRENGENKNVPNQVLKITVSNPKGINIYDKTLTTNEFGTVNGFFELAEKADLGVYNINVSTKDGSYINNSAGRTFRVEEYKKPEFEVTVKAETQQIKPGDSVKVKVNTKYYFGSPVTDAKIHYKIVKNNYYHYYYKPQSYDWLYGDYYYAYDSKMYGDPYNSNGAIFKEGDLKTDSEGNAFIDFDSEKSTIDLKYDILIDAVDKSRRLIKGAGSIKVTNTLFYAFIDFDNGFYAKGEKVKAEINLKTPDDEPVETKGNLKIFNVTYSGKNNEKENLEALEVEKLKSDKNGRIFYNWRAEKEGYYRFIFESLDKNNTKVIGQKDIWIAGDNFKGSKYKFRDVEVLTDKRTYEQGDTVRVMINTNYSDSYVMFSTETENAILSSKTFHIPSKSVLHSFIATKEHAPNFNIRAVTVRNNQLFNDQKEIFVPYSNQFINLDLNTKKDVFAPAEKSTIEIKTTDKNGKPVESEVSLAMVDSSIYYIQSDVSGDIRKHYYGERRNLQNTVNSSFNSYFYPITELKDKDNTYYQLHQNPLSSGELVSEDESDGYGVKGGNNSLKKAKKNGSSMYDNKVMAAPSVTGKASESSFDRAANSPKPSIKEEKQVTDDLSKKDSDKNIKQKPLEVSKEEIRSYFPDTAIWNPVILTDEKGSAKVDFTMPDSVTKWRLFANAVNNNSKVGTSDKNLTTRKDLLVRLQAPRFFVERDEIILSGIINNDFDTEKTVKCELTFSEELQNTEDSIKEVVIPAKGEKRVDWKVKVKEEGTAKITIKAVSGQEKDAVKMNFPVYVHGIDKNITENGIIKNSATKEITLKIPEQRKNGSTNLAINLSPSVTSNLIEALPYLVNYPYGCVEQTTSKFIPTVIVSNTLKNLGIDISKIQDKKQTKEIAEFSNKLDKRNKTHIYSNSEIELMVKQGLDRLYKFQNVDGGFGWWTGFYSDPYMSAYVINGFMIAKEGGYKIDENILNKAISYLSTQFDNKTSNYNNLYISYILSKTKNITKEKLTPFFEDRDSLNDYGKALLSLTYSNLGDKLKADLICQNLKDTVTVDKGTNTASWNNKKSNYYWWYWYNDRIETNSFILMAFIKARPNDKVVPMISNWLLLNRKSNHWYSTKDTANAIFALSEYAKINKENNPNYELSILHNNKEIKKIKITKENMFTFDNIINLDDEKLDPKNNKITIVKKGEGTLYYSLSQDFFTLEEDIKASGNQISVKRDYFKVTEKRDQDNKVYYDKTPIKQNDLLKSGDIVEVKLTLKANNDYEYLIFEDMKPAGFEATELKSGYVYQNGMSINQEFRDEKTVFFISNLPQGTQVLNYKLRAEIPGNFHVLPHKTYAMYAPEIKAISDEFRVRVED